MVQAVANVSALDRIIFDELAKLQDGLKLFRALDPEVDPSFNDQVGLMRCKSFEIAVGGGNRSGKSVPCFARDAAYARDTYITSITGEKIYIRPEKFRNKPVTMWFIGLQENYIGQTLYRILFEPGAFKVIRDKFTQELRAYRPWDEEDVARESECEPAPPLIPESEIESIAWKNKADCVFETVTLKNGAKLHAFASTAAAKEGDPVHYIHIDERINNSAHYTEWQARTLDYEGIIVWTAWPQDVANEAFEGVCERAETEAELVELGHRDYPRVSKFTFTVFGNPFIPKLSKERATDGSMGWDEATVQGRVYGNPSHVSIYIYPSFDEDYHSAIVDDPNDAVSNWLKAHGGVPGRTWLHELILDPGVIKPGVLFGAVPPRDLWNSSEPVMVVYDEIYTPRIDAVELAKAVADKVPPGVQFHRGIIDMRSGRTTGYGYKTPTREVYAKQLELKGIRFWRTDSTHFVAGNDNFQARRMMVDNALKSRDDGRPLLRIVTERCPNTIAQMRRNKLKMVNGTVTDEPVDREKNDLRACVEYWVSASPKWFPPPKAAKEWQEDVIERRLREMGAGEKKEVSFHIGPGVA